MLVRHHICVDQITQAHQVSAPSHSIECISLSRDKCVDVVFVRDQRHHGPIDEEEAEHFADVETTGL